LHSVHSAQLIKEFLLELERASLTVLGSRVQMEDSTLTKPLVASSVTPIPGVPRAPLVPPVHRVLQTKGWQLELDLVRVIAHGRDALGVSI